MTKDIKTKDHADIASTKRQLQEIQDDTIDIFNSVSSKADDEYLPDWWITKLAVSGAYLSSLRDFIVYETNAGATQDVGQPTALLVVRDDDLDVVVVEDENMLPPSVLQAREGKDGS